MKRLLTVVGILLLACVGVGLVAVLVGGGSDEEPAGGQAASGAATSRSATATAAPTSAGTPAVAASPTKPWGTSKEDVHVALAEGQTAEIRVGDGVYRLTLVKIVDPAQSTNEFIKPDEGKRFVLLQVLIENAGTSGITSGSWVLRDRDDFEYEADLVPTGFAEGEPLGFFELGPGAKKQGIVVFEIPQDAQIRFVKFDPNPFTSGEIYFDAE